MSQILTILSMLTGYNQDVENFNRVEIQKGILLKSWINPFLSVYQINIVWFANKLPLCYFKYISSTDCFKDQQYKYQLNWHLEHVQNKYVDTKTLSTIHEWFWVGQDSLEFFSEKSKMLYEISPDGFGS